MGRKGLRHCPDVLRPLQGRYGARMPHLGDGAPTCEGILREPDEGKG